MIFIAKTDSREGEESFWISEISKEILDTLTPLLIELKNNNGYFPTGDNIIPGETNISDLYGKFDTLQELINRLPTPIHGFLRIEEINVIEGNVSTLYM